MIKEKKLYVESCCESEYEQLSISMNLMLFDHPLTYT